MDMKSIPPDGSEWTLVNQATMGDVETCVWHRQGSNEFCWRPVEKRCSAARVTAKKPVWDFIKIMVPQAPAIEAAPLLVNDV